MRIAFLLVTCCLEQSRAEILHDVVANIKQQDPALARDLTVFDNASTQPGVTELLAKQFTNVYCCQRNVGYWTAIDWWLRQLAASEDPPEFTYIIESDMMHYAFDRIWGCADYLASHPDVGAVRLHEYSVADFRYYDKDRPILGSKKTIWQSHTNKVTGQGVKLVRAPEPEHRSIWRTNFLTQLPALNRFPTMLQAFEHLHQTQQFTEYEFQRVYHASYPVVAILDGGIFNADAASHGTKAVTGSWSSPDVLKRIGYLSTRFARIEPRDSYIVTRLG